MTRLAIIPARGGSKRIPRKNIRPFAGRPIIAWPIEAALKSGLFDTVMVSTDDDEIALLAEAEGAAVPFMRSSNTSDDHATTSDVLREVLEAYAARDAPPETVCCLYPTAPFVTVEDILAGHSLLENGDFDVVLPICQFNYPIWRALNLAVDGRISLFFPEHEYSRSQDLPEAFHDAGQWIWLRAAKFLAGSPLLGSKTGSLVLPQNRVQDIDSEDDWLLAEEKFELMRRKELGS